MTILLDNLHRPHARLIPAAMLLAALNAPCQTSGESKAQVIIVGMQSCCSEEAWPEAEKLAQAEFASLGFGVKVVDGSTAGEAERRIELEKIAADQDAVCALRIIRSPEGAGGGVDLWIADRVTGKTTFRHLSVEGESEGEAASVIALRVVELLRASLLELKIEGSAKGEVAPTPEVTEMIEDVNLPEPLTPEELEKARIETKSRKKDLSGPVGLRFGIEALGSPRSVGIMGGLDLAVRWNFIRFLSFEIEGLIALISKDISRDPTGASFNFTAVRAWMAWEILNQRVLRLSLGMGGGALIAWSTGYAPETYEVRTDWTHTGWVGGSLQAAFVLMKNLWLRLGFTAGACVPSMIVVFAGEQAATFGPAMFEGFVGIEGRVP
jgi:hypothetical protein